MNLIKKLFKNYHNTDYDDWDNREAEAIEDGEKAKELDKIKLFDKWRAETRGQLEILALQKRFDKAFWIAFKAGFAAAEKNE